MHRRGYNLANISNPIFMNESMILSILISLKFILKKNNDKSTFAFSYQVGVARRQAVILIYT